MDKTINPDSPVILCEADTLNEARKNAKAKLPEGAFIFSETVISDGNPLIIQGRGSSIEDAFSHACSQFTHDAIELERKIIQEPRAVIEKTEGWNETNVRDKAINAIGDKGTLKTIELLKPLKKGFLGFNRKPGVYRAEILYDAIVEVRVKLKPRITVSYCTEIASWSQLLEVMKIPERESQKDKLLLKHSHKVLYVFIKNRLNTPDFFRTVPFADVENVDMEKVNRYIDDPHIPEILKPFGSKMLPGRYVVVSDKKYIGRISDGNDTGLLRCIIDVAGCLKGQANYDPDDQQSLSNWAFKAVQYYAEIPVVNYIFTLSYIQYIFPDGYNELSQLEAKVFLYKGVEGLLLEAWEELGEGEIITDKLIIDKTIALIS